MSYATLAQIAHILKLTPRMVNLHVKEHGMPRVERGEYDLVACVHWYLDYKDQLIKSARRGDETEQQARARLVKATADLRELELAEARGQLISVGVVKFVFERIVVSFKTKILSIPSKLPQRLIVCKDLNQVKDLLEREINEVLNELSTSTIDISELGRSKGTPPVDGTSGEPPAEVDGKRVGRPEKEAKQGVKRRTGTVEDGQG